MKQQIEPVAKSLRVIRYQELYSKIGLGRTQIWRLEKDGEFPKSIPLGRNSKGWFEHEVDAWLESRRQQQK